LKGDLGLNTKVRVPALALAVRGLVVASALLVFRGGGLEGVLPGQPGVVRLRPGEKTVVGGAEVMVDFGVARYFVCRDRESGWERILEARAGWVLAVLVVYYDQPLYNPKHVARADRYTANLTTAKGETVRYCDEGTCGDKIWRVFWPRGEAVECRYYKNPYPTFHVLTFPIEPGEEPAIVRFHLYVDKTRYIVEVKIKD
jgi:hypothetical protein